MIVLLCDEPKPDNVAAAEWKQTQLEVDVYLVLPLLFTGEKISCGLHDGLMAANPSQYTIAVEILDIAIVLHDCQLVGCPSSVIDGKKIIEHIPWPAFKLACTDKRQNKQLVQLIDVTPNLFF